MALVIAAEGLVVPPKRPVMALVMAMADLEVPPKGASPN